MIVCSDVGRGPENSKTFMWNSPLFLALYADKSSMFWGLWPSRTLVCSIIDIVYTYVCVRVSVVSACDAVRWFRQSTKLCFDLAWIHDDWFLASSQKLAIIRNRIRDSVFRNSQQSQYVATSEQFSLTNGGNSSLYNQLIFSFQPRRRV